MLFWSKYVRSFIYAFSLCWGIAVYVFFVRTISSPDLQKIRITETYALTAITFLYFALLVSPLYSSFPNLPFRALYVKARRALGLSAFFFAVLHASFAFFGLLGGFGGLDFLNVKYLQAITLSFTALLILTIMAATSFDFMVRKLGRKWKMLHRLVYVAGSLIIIYALILGSQFEDQLGLVGQIFVYALLVLAVLEARRFARYLNHKFPGTRGLGLSNIFTAIIIVLLLGLYFLPGIGIPSQHLKQAKSF